MRAIGEHDGAQSVRAHKQSETLRTTKGARELLTIMVSRESGAQRVPPRKLAATKGAHNTIKALQPDFLRPHSLKRQPALRVALAEQTANHHHSRIILRRQFF